MKKGFSRIADEILFVSPDDKEFAIEQWGIEEKKCIEVAFGVEISKYPDDKASCKKAIKAIHKIRRR